MIKLVFIFLAFLSLLSGVVAQKDTYDQLKTQYDSLRKAENYESALLVAKQMNTWALKNETDTSLRYAVSMRYQGNTHETWGNTDSTIFYWNKSVELFENYHPRHPGYASSLNALGSLYYKMGDYKAAEPYYKQALEFKKKALGEEHPDYATSLKNLGLLYYKMGDYKTAEPYYKQALEIKKKALGEEHPDYAMSLSILGNLYYKIGDYKAAESYYKQALEIRKKALGEEHSSYATSLNNLGLLYNTMGDCKASELYYKQALEIRKKALGEEHLDYAQTLNNLGVLYSDMCDYKAAEPFIKQALEIRKKALGVEHPDYASSLNNLGNLYYDIGDYKAAEPYYKQALEIRKKALGVEHPDYATSLNNLGVLYSDMGDCKAAEPFIKQALEIRKKTLGEEHPAYASSLNNLGTLYSDIGDYKAAEPYYKQALEIIKKVLGEDHRDYASSINNLAMLYKNLGDYKAAEPYIKQALEIEKKALGEEHPDYATSLNNLGLLYYKLGDYKTAEPYYKQALEIKKKVLGEEHPDYATSINNLGMLYKNIGDYKAAEPFIKQALEIKKKALGEEHPDYSFIENSYAYLLMKTNREQQAFEILSKNFKKKASEIANNFEWLNDNQKEAYWKKESSFYDNLSWFANEANEKVPEAVGLNYNAALITKSKMLEAKISSENYYREVDELREKLAYRRRLLAKMESDGSTEKEKMEKLRKEADSLDKRLTLSWPEYAQQKKNLSITWDQVQQNLNKEEAAIEFVRFENEDDSVVYYNALVLKKGDKNPTLVKLCKEKDLQTIAPQMGYSAYYSLVWKPLETALNDVKTIYYAPTGELYNVPFHAIYAPKGKGDEVLAAKTDKRGVIIQNERAATEQNAEYLMDRYTMHQLTSTRYLAMGLKQKAKETIGNTMAMVGGVNYDYLPGSTTTPKKNKKDKNASRSSASASGKLNYLEGTKTEVEQINQQLTTATWQTKLIENNEAIEENITKLEGKEAKGILHLATHGYAFPEYDFSDTSISKNSLRYSYRYSTNPMVRSGLILAGGNWAWTGSDTLSKLGAEQNGILTALEVSQLNLKNTKLVVLSACETGLGKIEGSEGTFGLKRGFKLAGVEQMIVSLWSVPDKETMELMTLFYSDLTKTLNPVLSFEKAQKEMRNRYPTDPEKWAGFVLVR